MMPVRTASLLPFEDRQGWEELKLKAAAALGEPLDDLEVLGRDAGTRAYARAVTSRRRSVILVDASGMEPDVMTRFWRVSGVLDRAGVRVPRRLAYVPHLQLSVMTDLGAETLSARSQYEPLKRQCIQAALEPLARMAEVHSTAITGDYDSAAQLRDFCEIFMPAARRRGWVPPGRAEGLSAAVFGQLQELSPHGLVHVDYHSRNLVVDDEMRIGVLDFQDAAYGPMAVDWAAIVYDHNRLPTRPDVMLWEEEAVAAFGGRMEEKLIVPCLRWAGLFWHLRLAGACTRLFRQHKDRRFAGELQAVGRWLLVLAEMPELAGFKELARSIAQGTQVVAAEG